MDCKALGTVLSNTRSVAGPIDQHGSADLANNPRQATVLYRLGRDTSALSLKTAKAGKFWFNVTGDYYGTYRVNIYNYSGSRWENFTTLYTSSSGAGSYSRPMSGFYNAKVDHEFFGARKEVGECPQEFFSVTNVRSNFLCNLGYGDRSRLHPRNPRLDFEEACAIL